MLPSSCSFANSGALHVDGARATGMCLEYSLAQGMHVRRAPMRVAWLSWSRFAILSAAASCAGALRLELLGMVRGSHRERLDQHFAGRSDMSSAFARWHSYPTSIYALVRQFQEKGDTLSQEEQRKLGAALKDVFLAEISKWGHRRQWQKALAVLHQMEEKGIQQTAACWTAGVKACSDKIQGKQWRRALATLEQMQEHGFHPTLETYRWAMYACAKGRAPAHALGLLQLVEAHPTLNKDEEFLRTVLEVSKTLPVWELAVSTLSEMIQKQSELNLKKVDFAKAMAACEVSGQYEWVDWVEDEADKVGKEVTIREINFQVKHERTRV